MHSFPPHEERPSPRSKLGATLLRLHRSLESSRQREQAALDLFESWQSRWSEHREVIARRLEYLDQELAHLTLSAVPTPPLSLMSLHDAADDADEAVSQAAEEFTAEAEIAVDEAVAEAPVNESVADAATTDVKIIPVSLDGVDEGEQLPRASHLSWHNAERAKREQAVRRTGFKP